MADGVNQEFQNTTALVPAGRTGIWSLVPGSDPRVKPAEGLEGKGTHPREPGLLPQFSPYCCCGEETRAARKGQARGRGHGLPTRAAVH